MFNASVRIAVAMLLLALADFVLPQLWAAPDAGEPRVIADFRPALKGRDGNQLWGFYALGNTGDAAGIKDHSVDEVEIWDAEMRPAIKNSDGREA